MRKHKLTIFVVFVVVTALAASLASFAADAATASLNIQVASGNGITDGSIAAVDDMTANVTGLVGKRARVVRGLTLKKVRLPSTAYSDRLLVEFWLLNIQDIGRVLFNPKAFIRVRLYWLDTDQTGGGGSSACPSSRLAVQDGGTKYLCPDTGENASLYVTRRHAGGMLQSSKSGQDIFYIIGQITVPGGVPRGQQGRLSTLEFYASARRR